MVEAWITIDDLAEPVADPELAQAAIDAASFVLFHLSGRKYGGVRTTTEVYCQTGLNQLGISTYYGHSGYPPLPGPSGYTVMYPELQYGVITNRIGGLCNSCGCPHLMRLRGSPVLSVQSVYDGDRRVPLDDVVIYDYQYLTTPPAGCWRSCDDLEVTYTYGAPPPALGKMAAKVLADQLMLALTGSDECTLPQRVTQISRQNMSMTLLDPQDFLDKGRTGLYQVDLFISTVNPDGARLRARVFSPDIPRGKSYRWASQTAALAGSPAVQGMLLSANGEQVQPMASPMTMAMPMTTPSESAGMVVYQGQPVRWVVPGSFTQDHPPTVVVRPSGEEVPPDTLLWRNGNYTLDLTSEQVERLLPPGSVLVVSSTANDGSTTGETSYPVERRTL